MVLDIIGNISQMPLFEWFLIWILFLAIIYGLLQKSKLLGEQSSVNGTVAIAAAFIIANYTPIGLYASTMFYMLAIFLALVLIFVLVAGLAGAEIGGKGWEGIMKGAMWTILGTVAAIGVGIFGIIKYEITIDVTAIMSMMIIGVMLLAVYGMMKK